MLLVGSTSATVVAVQSRVGVPSRLQKLTFAVLTSPGYVSYFRSVGKRLMSWIVARNVTVAVAEVVDEVNTSICPV